MTETTIGAQRPAFALLARIADETPGLPGANLTIGRGSLTMSVQLRDGSDFEHWRVALAIQPAAVDLHVYASYCWLSATAQVDGVRVALTADVPLAPVIAVVTPRRDAERRERAAALTHRLRVALTHVDPIEGGETR